MGPRAGYDNLRMVSPVPSNEQLSPSDAPPCPTTGARTTDNAQSEVYDENGVDRSLIRSSLRRTPTECLEILEDMHRLASSVRPHSRSAVALDSHAPPRGSAQKARKR